MCDIRTYDDAQICAQNGVDFLGIHQITAPLTKDKFELCEKIRKNIPGISLVLVTKEENHSNLLDMCLNFKWDFLQLHFETSPQNILAIKAELNQYNCCPKLIAVIETAKVTKEKVVSFSNVVDFLLFDSSIRGGTGKVSSINELKRVVSIAKDVPYFLAGGLSPDNIEYILKITSPFSVDVQSGVEYSDPEYKHRKNPQRICDFCQKVRLSNGKS